jgi:uncharacterized protein (DUF1501 family)
MHSSEPALGQRNFSRRHLIRGAAGFAALMLAPSGAAAAASARRARSVIVLLMEGGMSQLETWDPKPEAPAEVRGTFGTIRTANPDLIVGEHMPLLAREAQRYNVIRSVQNHGGANHDHALHRLLTGYEHPTIRAPQDVLANHFPAQGAVVARMRSGRSPHGLPPFVTIPDRAQLGKTRRLLGASDVGPAGEAFEAGAVPATSEGAYAPPPGLISAPGITLGRLSDRRRLLRRMDDVHGAVEGMRDQLTAHQEQAFELLLGGAGRVAFDLEAEAPEVRRRYGASRMGQGALLARRLVEAGVSYVLVNCGDGQNLWDTHADNFRRLQTELLPPLDRAASTLLCDLDERGLLDETLVVMIGEFGRTPLVNKDAGRDHWPDASSVMLAGGGLVRGRVLGCTTARGEEPQERPVPMNEVLATIYHQLGIDPRAMLRDAEGRPIEILPDAMPIRELL